MLKFAFRWFGESDPVKIAYIKEIPSVTSIVTAIYSVPVGEVWPLEDIMAIKSEVNQNHLAFDVIESVPVHEDIKLGLPSRDKLIDNYLQTIRNLAKAGVRVVTYNFMPVFDWTRTDLNHENPDGSTSLVYYPKELEGKDPLKDDISLPGWDQSYKKEELRSLFALYHQITKEDLWNNLSYFLKRVIPVASELGIKMAIHPDDPPFDIFGLPRIITNEDGLDRLLKIVDCPSNSLALCTGSLGANPSNDLPKLVYKYAKMGRIAFIHVRNIRFKDGGFEECAINSPDGSLDIYRIMKALYDAKFDGYLRPDHGRMIFGETGKPGYGLYDRALALSYLNGIWDTLEKEKK